MLPEPSRVHEPQPAAQIGAKWLGATLAWVAPPAWPVLVDDRARSRIDESGGVGLHHLAYDLMARNVGKRQMFAERPLSAPGLHIREADATGDHPGVNAWPSGTSGTGSSKGWRGLPNAVTAIARIGFKRG